MTPWAICIIVSLLASSASSLLSLPLLGLEPPGWEVPGVLGDVVDGFELGFVNGFTESPPLAAEKSQVKAALLLCCEMPAFVSSVFLGPPEDW